MPNTKLTLKLDEEVIAEGKAYAARHGSSLSRLVETDLRERLLRESKPELGIFKASRDIPEDNSGAAYGIYVEGPLDALASPIPHDPRDPYFDRVEYHEHLARKHGL